MGQLAILTAREQLGAVLKGWMPWVGKGSLAILDQGLIAISSFLLNVLLVRWLPPAEYGAFALAYSVFLLLLVFHSSIFPGPMLVFGPGKYRECFSEYLGILLRGHFALMAPGAALLGTAALLLGLLYSPAVERAFLALAIAAPFILLLWLMRRAFYVLLNPGRAVAGGGVYLLALLAGILVLHASGHLTPATGFLTMGAASLIACLVFLLLLRPTTATGSTSIRAVAADHWRYGKWGAAGAGPTWIIENIYYLILPAWLGLAKVGAFKALTNLAQPALQSLSALGVLLLPVLVRDRDNGGHSAIKKTIKLSLALFLLGSACYLGVLWRDRLKIFHYLYAGKYSVYAGWPLLVVGLLPIAQSLPCVLGNALGALERPDLGFWSAVGGAIAALVFGVPLALTMGVGGALVGVLTSYVLTGALMLFFLMRSSKQAHDEN